MAAYFTRSIPRPPGYYRALNVRNTIDAGVPTDRRQNEQRVGRISLPERDIGDEDVYEVERLVQRRNGKVRYTLPAFFDALHHDLLLCRAGLSTLSCGRGTGKRTLPGWKSAI